MLLNESLAWLQAVVDRSGTLHQALSSIKVENGWIHGYDGRNYLSVRAEELSNESFIVPFDLFEVSVRFNHSRIQSNDSVVQMRGESSESRIVKLNLDEYPQCPNLRSLKWSEFAEEHYVALSRVIDFISDNAAHLWAAGVFFDGPAKRVLATNNTSLVASEFDCPSSERLIVPKWTLDFLARFRPPSHWCIEDNAIFFGWEDQVFLRSQRIACDFDERAIVLADNNLGVAMNFISEEDRITLQRACEIVPPFVSVMPRRVHAKSQNAEFEFRTDFDVGSFQQSPKVLGLIVKHFTHLDQVTSNFVRWSGEKILGISTRMMNA